MITNNFTFITIFASILSFLSILLTVFEYISAHLLLKSESVLVLSMSIKSQEISNLSGKSLDQFENLRKPISHEIGKITSIDKNLIELLKPKQTQDGCYLVFHIRIGVVANMDHGAQSQVIDLIKKEVSNGQLAKSLHRQWNDVMRNPNGYGNNHWKTPKIENLETKFLSGKSQSSNGDSAVIKMMSTAAKADNSPQVRQQGLSLSSIPESVAGRMTYAATNINTNTNTTTGAPNDMTSSNGLEMAVLTNNNNNTRENIVNNNVSNNSLIDIDDDAPTDGYGKEFETGHADYNEKNKLDEGNEPGHGIVASLSLAMAMGETHQGGDSVSLISEGM